MGRHRKRKRIGKVSSWLRAVAEAEAHLQKFGWKKYEELKAQGKIKPGQE